MTFITKAETQLETEMEANGVPTLKVVMASGYKIDAAKSIVARELMEKMGKTEAEANTIVDEQAKGLPQVVSSKTEQSALEPEQSSEGQKTPGEAAQVQEGEQAAQGAPAPEGGPTSAPTGKGKKNKQS